MLDHLLAILLLLVVPMRALWRSRPGRTASRTKITRYITTIGMVAGLLALLATSWLMTGRSAQALGLNAPTSTPSLIGLGVAIATFNALFLSKNKKPKPSQREEIDAVRRDLFPETPNEVKLFLLLSLAVGGGWEILYRGFLLYYLPARIGLLGAIIIAALAYGAAHGFKTPKQFVGSVVSALAFTIAYVATSNLWWLILLHIGVMLFGAIVSKAISGDLEAS
ncbi:membrane protease YdiL (CAAX protease family) [Sphingomonas sp. PvP055]|uniref:CPBP family intramembrane glutamic endopeptidase n=1 Tax=Sphingomonas sp. PvP055 TaxID=3156391 RepID=UPI0033977845